MDKQKELKTDIENLVNTIETLEDKLIDLHKEETQQKRDDLNYEIANILDDNYVYDLVRNRKRSDYYE